ncbi:MAG: hypothetical protein JXR05_06950 [Flavobacteriaceae bacterium]
MKNEIDKYKESLKSIHERRNRWESDTKNQIITSLTNINKQFDLDWKFEINDNIKNRESISLSFNNTSSGLLDKDINQTLNYEKIGGSLTFSQSYNGLIYIIITYPKIENILECEPKSKLLKTMEPKVIAGQTIRQNVTEFLKETTSWENSNGFN